MDRWKAEQGRGREKRKIRREKSRRERVRRKKIQMREKVGKSRFTVFFQWFVAPEGRKVGSLKRRVRSQLARWEMKNCTPLWREAHFEVKMYKTHQLRTTFGSCDVEKVHAVVAFKMCFAPQRRALFRHPNLQKWSIHGVFCTFSLRNVLRATTACTFFDSSTAKSGPHLVCFAHFDLEMCFAPKRCALFQQLNCQKWSAPGVFCTFWLGNVLRATTACTFSTAQLPKVVRTWCVLRILTWKCASRHNGVQFFISHLASWLRTRRFSEPTFRSSGATNHWKTQCFATFLPFRASASSFFWLFLFLLFSLLIFRFSLPLPCSAFHLSILSEVWLLNFLRLIIPANKCKKYVIPVVPHKAVAEVSKIGNL